MVCDILDSISNLMSNAFRVLGTDALFFIALAVEALIAVFFLVKSVFSYETQLNRALDKLSLWLFEKKVVTEDNIKELNYIFKTKAPKRLCYYWQQYILFREGAPSSYLSVENLIEKPLKTSSYNSNIKNLSLFSGLWALMSTMFVLAAVRDSYLTGMELVMALCVPIFVLLIGVVFVVYLRARKNSVLNSLYQNAQLFARFMDNACVDLPTYIDYQILFTPEEIENGQPVLREFLDYKARKEKEEFNKAKTDNVNTVSYDFSSTGVDGSIVLDRAMRESELFLKKKEKNLLKVSQLEGELDTRRKNFDNVQKEYQTKIQASKENVDRLRQMQEETTNRIESNYYRKQQTQEIAKQEQLEQEFEQQRAKYSLEKNECEEEIAKLNAQLEADKENVVKAMKSEYQTFFDKFCKSAEMVVAKVFEEKMAALQQENTSDKELITQLEIKLKNKPTDGTSAEPEAQGQFDEAGNFVYPDGTFYDKEGFFHDSEGNIFTQEGQLVTKAQPKEEPKQIVDFDSFDPFDFMTDTSAKEDVYGVAENVVKEVDSNIEINNSAVKQQEEAEEKGQTASSVMIEEPEVSEDILQNENLLKEEVQSQPVSENISTKNEVNQQAADKAASNNAESSGKKRGRPKKIVQPQEIKPKKSVGRPKKIVKEEVLQTEKRGRGRPKKASSIEEINKKLSEEAEKINQTRNSLNQDLQSAVNGINSTTDEKMARREQLIAEIDRLQNEAKQVIENNQPESDLQEINAKLETLLEEVKKLD